MDALQISPRHTSRDWQNLDSANPDHWVQAALILRDRLEGRFLQFASSCLKKKYSGFVVLAIDSLLAETIQQFREGLTDGKRQSERLIDKFLQGNAFQPDFDANARKAFYTDIRCGLLHQAEAKEMWLIRRNQANLLCPIEKGLGYVLDVKRFHGAVQVSLNEYLTLIAQPESEQVRGHLWHKMNHICRVRDARGALYEA